MWDGEFCKLCGCEQRISWMVDDVLWNFVVTPVYHNKVLCLECFLRMADDKGILIRRSDINFQHIVMNGFAP